MDGSEQYLWKTSSYSQGASNCVEFGLQVWPWKTSTYSTGQNNCVETASTGRRVLVRDTKDRSIPAVPVNPAAWETFLSFVR